MNYIDFIIVILLLISAINGAFKGFIYEVASLIALIGGVWGAIKFSHATETYLVERMDFTSNHINVIAFVITFLIIIVLVHFLAKVIEKALESVSLGAANRILGFVFATFKTLFILGIFAIMIEKIDESLPFIPEKDVQESKFYQPLRIMAINTFPFVQDLFKDLKKDAKTDQEGEEKKKAKTWFDSKDFTALYIFVFLPAGAIILIVT